MLSRHYSLSLLAFVLLTGCASALAGQPASTVHKSLSTTQAVPSGTTIRIENLVGQVTVQQGASQLEVTAAVVAGGKDQAAAQALADSVRLDVRHDGNTLVVHVHYPVDRHDSYLYIPPKGATDRDNGVHILGMTFGSSSSHSEVKYQNQRVSVYRGRDRGVPLHVDLVVSLPAGSHADIRNHVGPIGADNLHASLALHSDSGDIHANRITGRLAIHSDSGDATLADTQGTLTIDSDSGDVKVHNANGDATVDSDSGDVFITALRGNTLTVDADSGDIHVTDASASMRLNADSGDIWLKDLGSVPRLHANADSGDIHAHGDLRGIGSFNLETDSGDVRLSTTQPPAVHLEIHASDVHVDWPSVHAVRKRDNRFTGDVGKATGVGRINTDNGDVVLTQ